MNKGTSQNERMPEALDPGSFNVDERSVHDLFGEVQELAEVLAFYWPSFYENDGIRISMKNIHDRLVIQHCLLHARVKDSCEVRPDDIMNGIKREFHKNRRTI